jgi:hypothetical protein
MLELTHFFIIDLIDFGTVEVSKTAVFVITVCIEVPVK